MWITGIQVCQCLFFLTSFNIFAIWGWRVKPGLPPRFLAAAMLSLQDCLVKSGPRNSSKQVYSNTCIDHFHLVINSCHASVTNRTFRNLSMGLELGSGPWEAAGSSCAWPKESEADKETKAGRSPVSYGHTSTGPRQGCEGLHRPPSLAVILCIQSVIIHYLIKAHPNPLI